MQKIHNTMTIDYTKKLFDILKIDNNKLFQEFMDKNIQDSFMSFKYKIDYNDINNINVLIIKKLTHKQRNLFFQRVLKENYEYKYSIFKHNDIDFYVFESNQLYHLLYLVQNVFNIFYETTLVNKLIVDFTTNEIIEHDIEDCTTKKIIPNDYEYFKENNTFLYFDTYSNYQFNYFGVEDNKEALQIIFDNLNNLPNGIEFKKYIKNEIKFKFNIHYNFYKPPFYQATAHKQKKQIKSYYFLNPNPTEYQKNGFIHLITHELGHLYFWQYQQSIKSKDFYQWFKLNFEEINEEYGERVFYFQFSPNEIKKSNEIKIRSALQEYFCEMFALYCHNKLLTKHQEIFKTFLPLNFEYVN